MTIHKFPVVLWPLLNCQNLNLQPATITKIKIYIHSSAQLLMSKMISTITIILLCGQKQFRRMLKNIIRHHPLRFWQSIGRATLRIIDNKIAFIV